jgi:membrane protease YdiL (CAAX protease family)
MFARIWSSFKTLSFGLIALLAAQVPALAVLLWTRKHEVHPTPWPDLVNDGVAVAILICVSTPVLVGLLLWFARLRSSSALSYLALTLPEARDVKAIVLTAALMLAIGEGSSWALGQDSVTPFQINIYHSAEKAGILPWLWLSVVVMGPVGEEILFRGYLFRGWQSSLGTLGAVVATAFAWAILHLQYQLFFIVQIFLIGLTLGFARLITGSTVSTILLHVFLNALGLIETYFALRS